MRGFSSHEHQRIVRSKRAIQQELCHSLGTGFVAKSQGIFTLPVVALGGAVVGETGSGEISGKGKGESGGCATPALRLKPVEFVAHSNSRSRLVRVKRFVLRASGYALPHSREYAR